MCSYKLIRNAMKTLIVLLFISYNEACPAQCKCKNKKVSCQMPSKRFFPMLKDAEETTSLDLSNNNILNVSPNSIEDLPDLEELILDGNKIYFLENGAFKGVPHLKKLSIKNNNLHFIESNVFADLPLLEELYLTGNSLTELPSLLKNKALKKLCVSYNEIESIPNNAFTENSLLSSLKLTRNKFTFLPRSAFPDDVSSYTVINLVGNNFRAIPDVVKEMTNLEQLNVCFNPIKVFEAGEFRSFKKLKSLSMTNIGLFEISDSVFNLASLEKLYLGRNQVKANSLTNLQLPNLKVLVLNHNKMGDLAGNAFASTPKLEKLDLSHCSISAINEYTFQFLKGLKNLDLHGNRLNAVPILDGQTNLEELNLNENNISHVSVKDLRTMKLKKLRLSNNTLTDFAQNVSEALSYLTFLDLSYNQLESIPPFVFANLETLNISNNLIGNLSESSFIYFSKLKTLNLKGNNLTGLPDNVFEDTSELTDLFLCGNKLRSINSNALMKLPMLQVVTADKNMLVSVDGTIFSHNMNLKKISLNYNNLTTIDDNSFQNLTKLEELWLLYNDLMVPPKLTQNINLRTLALCGNPLGDLGEGSLNGPSGLEKLLLRDIGLTTFPDGVLPHSNKLQYLNLAGKNKLTVIPQAIKKMKSLEVLKLTGNPVTSVCSTTFSGMDNLRELRLNEMKLTSIDVTSFFPELPGLRTLYMGSNPWHCGCNLEWFALGINGHRADIQIMDRDKMTCGSPSRYKGKKLDYLRLGDFKQCTSTAVTDVGTESVILRLPQVGALSQNYNDVYHEVTYQPVGGGRKNVMMVKPNQREVVVEELTPNTMYILCVETVTSAGVTFTDEEEQIDSLSEERESCHKITTASSANSKPTGETAGKKATNPVSIHLITIYAAIGGVLFLALIAIIISITVWCRRDGPEEKKRFDEVDLEQSGEAPRNKNDGKAKDSTTKRRNDNNGVRLISKTESGSVNEACDVRAKNARTKL